MTTTETTIGINGMAHVMLTVSQFAAARQRKRQARAVFTKWRKGKT
jgi:hypothetical protein